MTDHVTRCPHCHTTFHVTAVQLDTAHGLVRCGACLQIFDATDNWVEVEAGDSSAAVAEDLAARPPREASAAPATGSPLPEADESWAEALLRDERMDEQGRISPTVGETALDEGALNDGAQQGNSPEQLAAATDTNTETHADATTESATLSAPEPATETGAETSAEPGPEADSSANTPTAVEAAAEPEAEYTPEPASELEPETETEIETEAVAAQGDTYVTESEAADAFSGEEVAVDAESNAQAAFDSDDNGIDATETADVAETAADDDDRALRALYRDAPAPARRNGLWLALSLLAAAGLGGQYLHHNFEQLAQSPYRPWLEWGCARSPLPCVLPPPTQLALIQSERLLVRSHPAHADALRVDAIISNRADFAQPFPALELRFSDLDGDTVASRHFQPREYLGGELVGVQLMPPQQPVQIALEIVDPGPRAVNYELSIRPAQARTSTAKRP